MNKRGLSILLVLCMLFSLMPALNMNANAAGGVLAKMDQAESVWPNGSHYVESANAGGAKTCYGFARELFLYVFGRTLPGFLASTIRQPCFVTQAEIPYIQTLS